MAQYASPQNCTTKAQMRRKYENVLRIETDLPNTMEFSALRCKYDRQNARWVILRRKNTPPERPCRPQGPARWRRACAPGPGGRRISRSAERILRTISCVDGARSTVVTHAPSSGSLFGDHSSTQRSLLELHRSLRARQASPGPHLVCCRIFYQLRALTTPTCPAYCFVRPSPAV